MSTVPNMITSFFHCAKCLDEMPEDVTPRHWARLEVGYTPRGFQIWCVRHEQNVGSFSFDPTDNVIEIH